MVPPPYLHGLFFLALHEAAAPVRPLEWKPTVDIPHDRTVRLAVRFDDRPGRGPSTVTSSTTPTAASLGAVHLDLPAETCRNLTEH